MNSEGKTAETPAASAVVVVVVVVEITTTIFLYFFLSLYIYKGTMRMSFCTISIYYTINQHIKSISHIQKPSKIPVFRAFSSVFCPFLHDFRSIFTHFCSIFAQNSLDFVHFHSKITRFLHGFHALRSFSYKFYSGQNKIGRAHV